MNFATEPFKPLLDVASVNNEKLRTVAVVNRTDNRKISSVVENHFKNFEEIKLLRSRIRSRAIYCESELSGSCVYTSKISAAKNEIALLVDEIIAELNIIN